MVTFAPVPTPELKQRGVVRQAELLDEYPEFSRAMIDDLVLDGDVERFPVGDHIMLKWVE